MTQPPITTDRSRFLTLCWETQAQFKDQRCRIKVFAVHFRRDVHLLTTCTTLRKSAPVVATGDDEASPSLKGVRLLHTAFIVQHAIRPRLPVMCLEPIVHRALDLYVSDVDDIHVRAPV